MERQLLNQVSKDYYEKFGKELIVSKSRSVGGGCISHAQQLITNEGDFFLKWNAHVSGELFIREAEALNEMASVKNEYLKIPRALLASEVSDYPGYILMDFLQSGNTSGDDEKLGRGLAVLHRETASAFGFNHDNYCGATVQNNQWCAGWIEFFGQQRIMYLVHLINKTRGLSTSEIANFEKLTDRLPLFLSHETKPSLIHGDLWSGNYMYTTSGPAIIDPASYYADREMELSIMTMFGGFSPRVWDAYQEMYPLPAGWKDRNRLYQLYHVLNHYFLFGGSYLNQANTIVRLFI